MSLQISLLDSWDEGDVVDLASLLVDCVEGGASVNFLRPMAFEDAVAWWMTTLTDPHSRTWVARDGGGRIVGCVRLGLPQQPNGLHRGEVGKMLVHRSARGRGAARALLQALESWAAASGRHRLVLDTETGSDAEGVYRRLGWTRVGDVPDFALTADGDLTSTTYYTKSLLPAEGGAPTGA